MVFSMTGMTEGGTYKNRYEIGPKYWFVKDYFLHVQMAWTTLVIHIGEHKIDTSRPLVLTVEVPVAVQRDAAASEIDPTAGLNPNFGDG